MPHSGTIGEMAELLGFAVSNVARSVGAIDLAQLTKPVEVAPAAAPLTATASFTSTGVGQTKAGSDGNSVFGTVAIPFKHLAAIKKLEPALAEIDGGTAVSCGSECSPSAAVVKASFTATEQSSIRDKLNAVNVAVNHSIRYARDIDLYHTADHWATPSETLAHGAGDCEDFAILKLAALRADGVAQSDMSVVVLFDQKRHFYHAVLSVAVGGHYFILDNMRDEVLPDTRLPDYLPLYSISGSKGYLHGSRVQGAAVAANTVPLEKVAPGEGTTF